MPQYEIPQEYENILSRYQQAYAGNMPGYEQTLSQTGQAGARARGAAERGAISSTAYGAQVGDIYQKELDAIQGLGVKQAEYKQAQLANVAQAEGQLGQQKSQQWEVNKYMPWQTEMNRYREMQKGGMQNLFGAIQSGVGTMTDFLGTKYATDAIKGLYPPQNGSTGQGGMSNPTVGGNYSPQQNLLNTLKGLTGGLKINNPQ
jgi:hypothetical protein